MIAVSVPEVPVAVDEHPSLDDEVGAARESRKPPVSKTVPAQERRGSLLYAGVPAADARHDPAALLLGKDVRHGTGWHASYLTVL